MMANIQIYISISTVIPYIYIYIYIISFEKKTVLSNLTHIKKYHNYKPLTHVGH
jgi:hypothetical protein